MNKHYIREDEEIPMTEQQIEREFTCDERRTRTRVIAVTGLFLVLVFAFCAKEAFAQTAPTFSCTNTTGQSPMSTACTWNYPGASACTASGTGAWTGTVPTSGTRSFSGITVAMTLNLDCTAPATGGRMLLRFIKPTRNTDGSTLTNLGGYLFEYGTAAGSLTQTRSVPLASIAVLTPTATDPYDSAYTLDGLTAGTWFAALKVRTTGCFPATTVTCYESVRTNTTSAPVTTTPGGALPRLSVTLEPYTVPNPATNLTATEATAFEIRPSSTGELLASRVGLVPVGTRCYPDARTVSGVTYNGVPIELVDFVNWPTASVLREAWARCGA